MQRAWRNKIESLRRAGLEYVDLHRIERISSPVPVDSLQDVHEPIVTESTTEHPHLKEDDLAAKKRLTQKDRLALLEILREEVASCDKCPQLAQTRTQTVFSDGTPTAELCFVGEAPGADEDATGKPFVGRAGQLLTKIIEACKLQREDVYICNVLKCRPPGNRNPNPIEVENCQGYLDRQLELVKPKIMVALGKFAAAHLLGEKPEKVAITKMRGNIREYRGIPFMITLHPAYLLRNPAAKRDVWDDMKEVMRFLGRPVE